MPAAMRRISDVGLDAAALSGREEPPLSESDESSPSSAMRLANCSAIDATPLVVGASSCCRQEKARAIRGVEAHPSLPFLCSLTSENKASVSAGCVVVTSPFSAASCGDWSSARVFSSI